MATKYLPLVVPSAPTGLRSFCDEYGVVQWQPPAQPNGVITGYDISIDGEVEERGVDPELRHYEITDLQGEADVQVSWR